MTRPRPLLLLLALATAAGSAAAEPAAEPIGTAAELAAGKPVEREIYSREGVFSEFDDLSALAPRGY